MEIISNAARVRAKKSFGVIEGFCVLDKVVLFAGKLLTIITKTINSYRCSVVRRPSRRKNFENTFSFTEYLFLSHRGWFSNFVF